MILPSAKFLQCNDGEQVAYINKPGEGLGIVFLPGYQSTMRGTKSEAFFELCEESNLEYTTFDYYGHGESSMSDERKGTIGRWKGDAIEVLDRVTSNPRQLLIGSSMGGWISWLVLKERRQRIAGILNIATAPDFTQLLRKEIDDNNDLCIQMNSVGYSDIRTHYDKKGYYRIFQEFLNEAEQHFILQTFKDDYFDIDVPVSFVHGTNDIDISSMWSERLYDSLNTNDKEFLLVTDGDHRLSRPEDITCIKEYLKKLLSKIKNL